MQVKGCSFTGGYPIWIGRLELVGGGDGMGLVGLVEYMYSLCNPHGCLNGISPFYFQTFCWFLFVLLHYSMNVTFIFCIDAMG